MCLALAWQLWSRLTTKINQVFAPSEDEGTELGEKALWMKLPLLALCPEMVFVCSTKQELKMLGLLLVELDQAVQGGQMGPWSGLGSRSARIGWETLMVS